MKDGSAKMIELEVQNGFEVVNGEYVKGASIFTNGKVFISADVDGHYAGVWKMAKKLKDLYSKKTRMGTYDKNLNKIGD